jgi:DNA-binding Xre family transcriptional regulator
MTDLIENAIDELAERIAEAKNPFLGALVAANAVPSKWLEWPFHKAFGLFRRSRGLTQAELAARAGVARCQIVHLEKGRDIRLKTLRRIFAALDCDLVLLPRSDKLIAAIENERRRADRETNLYWDGRLGKALGP